MHFPGLDGHPITNQPDENSQRLHKQVNSVRPLIILKFETKNLNCMRVDESILQTPEEAINKR